MTTADTRVPEGEPRPPVPRLLAVSGGTATAEGPDRSFDDWLALLAEAGSGRGFLAVQLREKHLDDRRLFDLARRARRALPPTVRSLINGRLDVALAAGADGVHLPAAGLPAEPLRRRFGPGLLIGVSTHSVTEVAAAREAGADYVTYGPVWPTPSKPGLRDVPGLEGLERAASLGLPVLALGGVDDLERLGRALAAGAHGAAGIRAFRRPDLVAAFAARLGGTEGAPGGSTAVPGEAG